MRYPNKNNSHKEGTWDLKKVEWKGFYRDLQNEMETLQPEEMNAWDLPKRSKNLSPG